MAVRLGVTAAILAAALGSVSLTAIRAGNDLVWEQYVAPAVPQELGEAPGAHRYWRVYGYDNSTNAVYIGWSQMEFRDTIGGANVATGGTADHATPLQAGAGSQMFNGAPTTSIVQWQIGAGMPNNETWVSYDFGVGVTKEIVEVKLWPNKDQASRTPRIFSVQWSDNNTDWHTSWTAHNHNWVIGNPGTYARPTFAAAMRHWRIRQNSTLFNDGYISATEIEFRESIGGSDVTSGGTAYGSFHNGTEAPANAFDNNTATVWAGNNNNWPRRHWIAYDFGSGVTKEINEIVWTSKNDSFWTQSLNEGIVESSPDGINFIPRWDVVTNITGQNQAKVCSRKTTAMAALYTNKGGRGDRTAFITVTTSALWSGPSPYQVLLVNGSYSNQVWFNAGQSNVSVTFDFTTAVLIQQATWFQDNASSHGTWKWQASHDGTTWVDIGSTFTLGGAATTIHSELHDNVSTYRYYRLQQVSGTTSSSPYLREIEFRIAGL